MLKKFKTVGSKVAGSAKQGASKASSSVRAKASKSDDRYLVALDIGTEFVKALIGHVSEDGQTGRNSWRWPGSSIVE
jgi:hypothetical protein